MGSISLFRDSYSRRVADNLGGKMEERKACGVSVLPAAAALDLDDTDASSRDDEQQEEPKPSVEYDPYYDHTDIADRFYACEIEEIPSFRWMTPSQRIVDPPDIVKQEEGPSGIPRHTPEGALGLRIEMDSLLAHKEELESCIQSAGHLPKPEVEVWLQEVEKQGQQVDRLLARRSSSPFILGAWFQRPQNFGEQLNALDQLHRQRANWGDDDIFMESESDRNVHDEKLDSKYAKGGGSTVLADSSSSPPTPATPQRPEGEILQPNNLKVFAFSDLKAATRNFRPDSLLGEGGFGSVFKGWIDENTLAAARPGTGAVIAVKRLHLEGFFVHLEWLTEINYLSRLNHPNVVKLLGYCLEDADRMLVYEFMPKGSLDNHLFTRDPDLPPLSWNNRMKIALEAAKGVAFLHNAKPKVIHRDLKSSNILLDSSYNAKLSGFELAKDGPIGEKSRVSTRVMGTYGYAAPEYVATGHLTARSDVYGFGVVLLELLTGRRALDRSRPSREHSLVDWARPELCHKRRIYRVLDPRFEGQYPLAGAQKAAALALQCVCVDPKFRPGMDEVVAALDQLQNARDVGRGTQASRTSGGGVQRVGGGGGQRRSLPESGHRKVAFQRPAAAAASQHSVAPKE